MDDLPQAHHASESFFESHPTPTAPLQAVPKPLGLSPPTATGNTPSSSQAPTYSRHFDNPYPTGPMQPQYAPRPGQYPGYDQGVYHGGGSHPMPAGNQFQGPPGYPAGYQAAYPSPRPYGMDQSGYGPGPHGPGEYGPQQYGHGPPPRGQQQQQQTVIIGVAPPVIHQVAISQSFTNHMSLACFVFWCCGCLFGLIAFILAACASNQARQDPASARQLGKASIAVSVTGIVVAVIAAAIVVGVCVRYNIQPYTQPATNCLSSSGVRCNNAYSGF